MLLLGQRTEDADRCSKREAGRPKRTPTSPQPQTSGVRRGAARTPSGPLSGNANERERERVKNFKDFLTLVDLGLRHRPRKIDCHRNTIQTERNRVDHEMNQFS